MNVKGHSSRPAPLGETYDIFERLRTGELWVESFTGLPGLSERLIQLNAMRPGEYFAYSVHDAKVVAEIPRATSSGLPADTSGHLEATAHESPAERGTKGNGTNGNGTNGNDVKAEHSPLNVSENHQRAYRPNREPDTNTATPSDVAPPE